MLGKAAMTSAKRTKSYNRSLHSSTIQGAKGSILKGDNGLAYTTIAKGLLNAIILPYDEVKYQEAYILTRGTTKKSFYMR